MFYINRFPESFTRHSAFAWLCREAAVPCAEFDLRHRRVMKHSWRLGRALQRYGEYYYGSGWNALLPYWDELRFLIKAPPKCHAVHFLWAEFASPRYRWPYRKMGTKVLGTFHCSARRLPRVLNGFRCFESFDRISVVSASQIDYFVSEGVAREKIDVTHLGVDTDYFCASTTRCLRDALQVLLVGKTERDHVFAAELMGKLRDRRVALSVCTSEENAPLYRGLPNVTVMPYLDDDDLVALYQASDLLLMPVLDCTANDALLESMACGTPVMINRVGGVPEYVDPSANFVLDGKELDEWADVIIRMQADRSMVLDRREMVRDGALKFSWPTVVRQWHRFQRNALRVSAPVL